MPTRYELATEMNFWDVLGVVGCALAVCAVVYGIFWLIGNKIVK